MATPRTIIQSGKCESTRTQWLDVDMSHWRRPLHARCVPQPSRPREVWSATNSPRVEINTVNSFAHAASSSSEETSFCDTSEISTPARRLVTIKSKSQYRHQQSPKAAMKITSWSVFMYWWTAAFESAPSPFRISRPLGQIRPCQHDH